MATGEYDPEVAARSVRELAAVTDADLAAEIRAAAAAVAAHAEAWRGSPGWPFGGADRRAYAAVASARGALAELGDQADLSAVVRAVSPILGVWWPEQPTAVAATREAVERLRHAAKVRPSLVAESRGVVAAGLV